MINYRVASDGRQRTPMDGASHVKQTAALAVRIAGGLRDEEAAGSNPKVPESAAIGSRGKTGQVSRLTLVRQPPGRPARSLPRWTGNGRTPEIRLRIWPGVVLGCGCRVDGAVVCLITAEADRLRFQTDPARIRRPAGTAGSLAV